MTFQRLSTSADENPGTSLELVPRCGFAVKNSTNSLYFFRTSPVPEVGGFILRKHGLRGAGFLSFAQPTPTPTAERITPLWAKPTLRGFIKKTHSFWPGSGKSWFPPL
ncbi:hypothetical protein QNM34_08830 [Rahnella bonaserana]|uniref:hypothetical protein n=1 Tax=Rahnella bonaserana TaxID=2816248 RepID=UPI0024C377E2|nr:hypothetical protein [Rahnella bonaserana]WHZ42356.1 hypothetical protein QNM34_08830 [Rahnella bonaserana]